MSDQRDTARSAPRSVAAPAVHVARGDPPTDTSTRCTCSTTAMPAPDGLVIVLRVAGEVDLCTVGLLQTVLDTVLARRPGHLIVDLSELGFCSSHGLRVLGHAGDTALGWGIGYAVAGASARLNRTWAMGWTAAERPIGFPSTADAVLAAMAHQVGAQDRARWAPKHLITAALVPVVAVTAPVALIA